MNLGTLESIFENPDWEGFQYFYIHIRKWDNDQFKAELLLFASEEGDPHFIVRGDGESIENALASLEEQLEEKIISNAAGTFMEEALREEEEEK